MNGLGSEYFILPGINLMVKKKKSVMVLGIFFFNPCIGRLLLFTMFVTKDEFTSL